MIKAIFTKQMLIDDGACEDQVDLFEEKFGDQVNVTIKRAAKVAALFDWGWGVRFLDAQGKAEYEKARAHAWAEYEKVIAPAWAEYEKARAHAWAEYEKAIAPASAEYEKVTAHAWAEYEKAIAPVWAEYKKAIAPAWAAAYISTYERKSA